MDVEQKGLAVLDYLTWYKISVWQHPSGYKKIHILHFVICNHFVIFQKEYVIFNWLYQQMNIHFNHINLVWRCSLDQL